MSQLVVGRGRDTDTKSETESSQYKDIIEIHFVNLTSLLMRFFGMIIPF